MLCYITYVMLSFDYVSCYVTFRVMLYNICHVCYITCVVLCYNHVSCYVIKCVVVMLYNTCRVLLYNICYFMLYNIRHVIV